jgi:hypothetical protein
MSLQKSKKQEKRIDKDSKNKISKILDEIIQESLDSTQYDSFYSKKAAEIRSIDKECFPFVAKRFQKANPKEKEIILQLLKHFQGVEHIKFFHEFIHRESFLPRTGLVILELFNKSDALLEEGLSSRLLDLDDIAQRIKLAIVNGKLKNSLVDEFIKRDENEKEGIIHQLIEETGTKISSFIIKIIETDEKTGGNVLRFVSLLPAVDSFNILQDIYRKTNRKEILKIIKKTVHVLKQKGIEVSFPLIEDKRDAVFKKATLPESRAFISAIDAEGYRLMFVVKPVTTYETRIFNIFMSDVKGIQNFQVINAFRKESQLFIDKLLSDKKTEFLETQPDNVAFLVEEACKTTEEQGSAVSANISQWRNMFSGQIGVRKRPVIYDYFNEEEIKSRSDLLGRVEELFERTDIVFWFIVSEEAKEKWMKMKNILYSPLVLSNIQKEERIYGLLVDTARQFFDEGRKRIFKRRLEELSYFIYKKGQEESANIALSVACSLVSPDMRPENNQFCMGMVKKGFKYFESTHKGADGKQDSMIIDPKDFSLVV